MRKWRAENRDKNKQNDLRCRVYRLARQKFGDGDSEEKHQFIVDEINRRLGRRMLIEQQNQKKAKTEEPETNEEENQATVSNTITGPTITAIVTTSTAKIAVLAPSNSSKSKEFDELPFYCAPRHKIELPSINMTNRRPSQGSTEPSDYTNKSQSPSPSTSDSVWHEERQSELRAGSEDTQQCQEQRLPLPPMQSILPSYLPFPPY
ncbi:hypothetical protein K501DRAFT_287875, partial [Backusella circina FSU 941]